MILLGYYRPLKIKSLSGGTDSSNTTITNPNSMFSKDINSHVKCICKHTYSITNFKFTATAKENGAIIFNETSTTILREGHVMGIPTTILLWLIK